MKNLLRITFFAAIFFVLHSSILSQEKYAVIITGDYADLQGSWATANGEGRSAMVEFWNDTYLMWETLIFKGYDNDNIFVLFANNVDYYHDNNDIRYKPQLEYDSIIGPDEKITDYKASKEKVLMVLTGMADGLNPDIPQLTEDDFLYVYTFGHGHYAVSEPGGTEVFRTFLCLMDYNWDVPDTEWDELHSITDIELNTLLDNISANKKLVVMQQCASGGFIEELEESNVIISTAANDSMAARTADEIYHDNIEFWDDPTPGTTHDAEEFETYSTSTHMYTHGEYNLHFLSSINGKTPDNETTVYSVPTYQDFPLSDADNNTDNIISITEAFDWIILLDSWRAAWNINGQGHDDPQLSHSNDLALYTSLEYPTLLFDTIAAFAGQSITHRGIIGISKDVVILNSTQLTFINNADVYLLNDAKLIVDAGATLVLEDNVSIIARGGDNSLIVNGDIQIGDNVTFKSESENQLELLIGNQSLNLTIDYPQIENTHINSSSASLNIYMQM